MSTCLAHPDRAAVASCSACGADTCAACEVRFRDASWCEACFAARSHAHAGVPGTPPGAPPPPPPPPAMPQAAYVRSPGLAALLSFFVPGLGTMYCFGGPARRALVEFAAWAFGLWVVVRAEGLFAFVMFLAWTAFWIWQITDAYRTATTFNALGRVPSEDEAAAMGLGPFIVQDADSRSLGMALLVVGCVLLVVEAGGVLLSGMRFVLPFGLVALGVWITWRARRRSADERQPAAGEPA